MLPNLHSKNVTVSSRNAIFIIVVFGHFCLWHCGLCCFMGCPGYCNGGLGERG